MGDRSPADVVVICPIELECGALHPRSAELKQVAQVKTNTIRTITNLSQRLTFDFLSLLTTMASAVSSHRSTPIFDLTVSDDEDDDIIMTSRQYANLPRQVSSVDNA